MTIPLTEDEAKTKWCPQSMGTDQRERCDGSACMAWRWEKLANPDWVYPSDQYPPHNPYGTTPAYIRSKTDGFCGLAGQP